MQTAKKEKVKQKIFASPLLYHHHPSKSHSKRLNTQIKVSKPSFPIKNKKSIPGKRLFVNKSTVLIKSKIVPTLKTQEMIEQQPDECFLKMRYDNYVSKLFQKLNFNNKGIICEKNITYNKAINEKQFYFFGGIFQKIKEKSLKLDFQQFLDLSGLLFLQTQEEDIEQLLQQKNENKKNEQNKKQKQNEKDGQNMLIIEDYAFEKRMIFSKEAVIKAQQYERSQSDIYSSMKIKELNTKVDNYIMTSTERIQAYRKVLKEIN